jgi:DNA-binding MarR family transcriptional regulator
MSTWLTYLEGTNVAMAKNAILRPVAGPERGAAAGEPGDDEPGDKEIDFQLIELLFFAYRDFTSDPDAILDRIEFGRAHHRVVHFVNREPGLTVADLLDTLKITKQSLARVLKQLVDSGHIDQVAGPQDRRQRKLYTTEKGRRLALALAEPQSRRIARALDAAGRDSRPVIEAFLRGMVDRTPAKNGR